MGEDVGAHVVKCEGAFDLVRGQLSFGKNVADVVDEDVEVWEVRLEGFSERSELALLAQVRGNEPHCRIFCLLLNLLPRFFPFLFISPDNDHVKTFFHDLCRGFFPDSTCTAGNDDGPARAFSFGTR